ncbi:Co2+/Mg2+ efflux protein ApaG [Endothiovibrio diazotrophicus]
MDNKIIQHDIRVQVESFYIPEQSDPIIGRYVFAYNVSIRNEGSTPAKLISRHWIITDANGHIQEVEGDGVVGEQPYLQPGEKFHYTSGAMLETPVGSMHGSYRLVDDDGIHFEAEIPAFTLSRPHSLH